MDRVSTATRPAKAAAAPAEKAALNWPATWTTAKDWADNVPHFSAEACERMAAKECARIAEDAARYLQLVDGCTAAGLPQSALDNMRAAAAHGFSFDHYVESIERALNPPVDPDAAFHEVARRLASAKDNAERLAGLVDSDEAEKVWEVADVAAAKVFVEVMDTPALTPDGITDKLRLYIDRVHCGMVADDVDSEETIARFIDHPNLDGPWGVVRIYQDMLRLIGDRWDLVQVGSAQFAEAAE